MSQAGQGGCPFEHIDDPDREAEQIGATAALSVMLLDKRYPSPNPIRRGVHPKSHGCIRASFTINAGIGPQLRVGLFAEPSRRFDAFIRFSNAAAVVGPDIDKNGNHGSRGMAIKVFNVGSDVLSKDGDAQNQDFLMINQPVFAFANTEDYLRLNKVLDRDGDVADRFFSPLQLANPALPEERKQEIRDYMKVEAISAEAVGRIHDSFNIVGQIHAMPVANPLGTQYFSAAPFLFGPDRVMKFSAKPCQVVPPTDIPTPPAPDYLTDVLTETMQRHCDLQFDFMVQVRGADADLGVENASSLWDESKYPFVPVARITIHTPQPGIDDAEHREHCEKLAFTPWHCLAAHQPIGSINRLRRAVYLASAAHRLG